ncbi:MAG: serine/threonine-protein kinase [Candidatus Melainabacteria bacterium]|nr:serine/threonine-protein kinase [Candidatus Melainabacteria bacterium]
MNQNDQSQGSQSLENSSFDSGQVTDGQDSTRLTSGSAVDLTDSSFTEVLPQVLDGKLKPLDLVGENYEIISLLGVGGMGYVYRVRHRILQKLFAMKTLSSQQVTEIAWRRLQVEAQAIARMNHPNIVGIYNLGLHEERLPYYVMDLLDGEALADRLKRDSALSLAEALPIFIEVCSGLGYAHKKGIIHRDIKPGNIILLHKADSAGATIKIVDFGIAKLSGVSDPNNQHLTSMGEVFGSPYYMSPEQCIGGRIDARSDIYSLGCTLFEALVGHPPFKGANPVMTMTLHQSQEPPTLRKASGRNFPDSIEQVVARLLAKAPMNRYQSLEKVVYDLNAIQAGRELESAVLFTTKRLEIEQTAPLTSIDRTIRGTRTTIVLSVVLLISVTILLLQIRPARTDKLSNASLTPVMASANQTTTVLANKNLNSQLSLKESDDSDYLPAATKVNLSYCGKATDEDIARIDRFQSMTELTVSHTRITGQGLAQLKCLKRLKVLEYSDGTQLSALLKALAGSNELTRLTINNSKGNSLSTTDWKLIATCKKLEYIEAVGSNISKEGMAALDGLPNLKFICTKANKENLKIRSRI